MDRQLIGTTLSHFKITAKGITHRDLKPSKVMVSDDGRVRVLDFGLAKLVERAVDSEAYDTYQAYGDYLEVLGLWPESIAVGKRSVEVDPISAGMRMNLGLTYNMAREPEEAEEILRQPQTTNLTSRFPMCSRSWPGPDPYT